MLRALEIGIPPRDLELYTIGMVMDLYIELSNDSTGGEDEVTEAGQAEFDAF